MTPKNINRQAIVDLLQEDFLISYAGAEIKRMDTIQLSWMVRWEDYFNPHANPKSLFSVKSFDDIDDAVDFFLLKLKIPTNETLEELGFEDLTEDQKANIQLGRNLT